MYAVVTGASSAKGIGRALLRRCRERADQVAVFDIKPLEQPCSDEGIHFYQVDLTDEAAVDAALSHFRIKHCAGQPITMCCSNAGMMWPVDPTWHSCGQTSQQWLTSFRVNVLSHVILTRLLLRQRHGTLHLIFTSSAAGLLTAPGEAAYTSNKHALVSFAESVAIGHADDGVRVVCLCPQAVSTNMLDRSFSSSERDQRSSSLHPAVADGVISADAAASAAFDALDSGRFLALPHAQVDAYERFHVSHRDQWLKTLQKSRRAWLSARL